MQYARYHTAFLNAGAPCAINPTHATHPGIASGGVKKPHALSKPHQNCDAQNNNIYIYQNFFLFKIKKTQKDFILPKLSLGEYLLESLSARQRRNMALFGNHAHCVFLVSIAFLFTIATLEDHVDLQGPVTCAARTWRRVNSLNLELKVLNALPPIHPCASFTSQFSLGRIIGLLRRLSCDHWWVCRGAYCWPAPV